MNAPPTTMRAAVLVDVGRLELRNVPFVAPTLREVVVQVQAVGMRPWQQLEPLPADANFGSFTSAPQYARTRRRCGEFPDQQILVDVSACS